MMVAIPALHGDISEQRLQACSNCGVFCGGEKVEQVIDGIWYEQQCDVYGEELSFMV